MNKIEDGDKVWAATTAGMAIGQDTVEDPCAGAVRCWDDETGEETGWVPCLSSRGELLYDEGCAPMSLGAALAGALIWREEVMTE